jgi:hypothetical protein
MNDNDRKVNRFNENIKFLLQSKRKSIESLAHFLRYEVDAVKRQLNAKETFQFPDLIRICAFFNLLPADFFYDRLPEQYCVVSKEMEESMYDVTIRIRETHHQVVNHFFSRVVYN